jgi:hypothetical protein
MRLREGSRIFKAANIMRGMLVAGALAAICVVGCGPKAPKALEICPGKTSLAESLIVLRSRFENAASFKADGKCTARFYDPDKEKYRKESFDVTVWFDSPSNLLLHGDIAFNPRGLVVGSNAEEFWLAMKPKELGNSYYSGKWSEARGFARLILSPRMLLEAFGVIDVGDARMWSLSNEGAMDVLAARDEAGQIVKKVYIYSCDYNVRKIEYFSDGKEPAAILELGDYENVGPDASVPVVINIITASKNRTRDSFKVKFSSIKPYEFNAENRRRFFEPRSPKGFEHVYRVIGEHSFPQE